MSDKRKFPKTKRFVFVLRWPVQKLKGNRSVVVLGDMTGNLNQVTSLEMEGRNEVLEVVV